MVGLWLLKHDTYYAIIVRADFAEWTAAGGNHHQPRDRQWLPAAPVASRLQVGAAQDQRLAPWMVSQLVRLHGSDVRLDASEKDGLEELWVLGLRRPQARAVGGV